MKGEWAEAKGEKFDFIGSIIYSLSLVGIMYGFSLLPAIMSGAVKSPVLNINLFRNNTVFTFSSLAALINCSATFAVTFLLSLYLQYIRGLSPQNAGLILVSQPVVMAIFSPLAGRLSDRIEPRVIASAGMALTAVALSLFTFLGDETSLTFILDGLILLGFGHALFSSPNTNAFMSSVGKRYYGVASRTLGTMRLIGQTLSMGIAMLLFAICIGRAQITPECYLAFLKSEKAAFIIFAGLCFGGIFASLVTGKIR